MSIKENGQARRQPPYGGETEQYDGYLDYEEGSERLRLQEKRRSFLKRTGTAIAGVLVGVAIHYVGSLVWERWPIYTKPALSKSSPITGPDPPPIDRAFVLIPRCETKGQSDNEQKTRSL
jgi:hypothetical protein